MWRSAALGFSLLAGCGAAPEPTTDPFEPRYDGIEAAMLDDDLVRVRVAMRGARDSTDLDRYAACAVSQYALDHEFGFARHVRTIVDVSAGIWRADAVYTISPSLPRGSRTIDAEVTAAECGLSGIPTV